MVLSKTQLDRLGDRLRSASSEDAVEAADRSAYDDYRSSLVESLNLVMEQVADISGETPTSRLKTLKSTLAKLVRQPKTRLSQVQDVVGCRIVVPSLNSQDEAVKTIAERFPVNQIDDRRERHQNGYRAVHVVARLENGATVEIQVRTPRQNAWANLCETLTDRVDPAFKYGGGDPDLRDPLMELSELLSRLDVIVDEAVPQIAGLRKQIEAYKRSRSKRKRDAMMQEIDASLPGAETLVTEGQHIGEQVVATAARLSEALEKAIESKRQ